MIIATFWLLEFGGVVILNQINIFDPMVNNTDTIKNFYFFHIGRILAKRWIQ